MDHTLIVLSALLVNLLFGGFSSVYQRLGLSALTHLPAQGVRDIERRLNREHRSVEERIMRGWVFALFSGAACIILGTLLSWILEDEWQIAEIILLAILLPLRGTWKIASAIRSALLKGKLNDARRALAGTVWKHHAKLDEHGVSRAAIEMIAVHFSEKIVAPVLFYLLFGLPGFFVSKTIYLMQETLVRPTESEQAFAKAAHTLHFILHYLTARLTAMLWLVAAIFMPSADVKDATQQVIYGFFGETPQDIALLGAGAVLRLSLGGPTSAYVHEGWIGAGTAKATQADIGRAQRALILVQLLLFCFVGLFI
jgi:adenosylcobinamide-phosphate synthase